MNAEIERRYPLRFGDVFALQDSDYMFGEGDFLFQVTVVHDYREVRGTDWVFLRGWQLRPDGSPCKRRDVLVRCEILRARRRPT